MYKIKKFNITCHILKLDNDKVPVLQTYLFVSDRHICNRPRADEETVSLHIRFLTFIMDCNLDNKVR